MAAAPIVLTTDFGLADPYVGVMKGVILGINPGAAIIDLTHQVQPQNIRQGAFILGTSYRFFPAGAIHIAVVDPGVGTHRRALLVVTPQGRFLAPDNGILSYVLRDYLADPPRQAGPMPVPSTVTAYQLNNPEYWLHPVSRTFHGRDIFAPAAAHLSLGVPPERLGQPVEDLLFLTVPRPARRGNTLQGEIVYADHFGNLITNIPALELEPLIDRLIVVEVKGRRISRLSQSYQDVPDSPGDGLLALVGSHGYLEVAVRQGNAASILGVGAGEPVYVTAS